MECRINFLTHLAFQLLWMGLACTGLPPITLCIANHRCITFYSFLMLCKAIGCYGCSFWESCC